MLIVEPRGPLQAHLVARTDSEAEALDALLAPLAPLALLAPLAPLAAHVGLVSQTPWCVTFKAVFTVGSPGTQGRRTLVRVAKAVLSFKPSSRSTTASQRVTMGPLKTTWTSMAFRVALPRR